MWSVGCILAELLLRKPLFPGRNEIDQLELIFKLCGTPTEATWPSVSKLPWYKFKPKKVYKPRLREVFKDFPLCTQDLVERLLCLDPDKRATASDALDSDYFWTDPMPCDPSSLPKYPSSHEFQTKRRRQQEQGNNGEGPLKRPRLTSQNPPQGTHVFDKAYGSGSASVPRESTHTTGNWRGPPPRRGGPSGQDPSGNMAGALPHHGNGL